MVNVKDCPLVEGVTECTNECVKCKLAELYNVNLADLKSERMWLEQHDIQEN